MSTRTRRTGWAGLFEAAFGRSENAMGLVDSGRNLIEVNRAFARLLGYRPSDFLGRHMWDFVAGGPQMTGAEWDRAILQNELVGEAELVRADGSTVTVQYAAHPEIVTGHRLVLFVALSTSRWGRHFRRVPRQENGRGTLSKREREVVHLVALGETSPEIASTLHISENTVRKHVSSAMEKVGARSRAHLVAKVLGEGHTASQA